MKHVIMQPVYQACTIECALQCPASIMAAQWHTQGWCTDFQPIDCLIGLVVHVQQIMLCFLIKRGKECHSD